MGFISVYKVYCTFFFRYDMKILNKLLSRKVKTFAHRLTFKLPVVLVDFKQIWNGLLNFSQIERDISVLFNDCLDCCHYGLKYLWSMSEVRN
jgi:hypothetical protein